MLIKWKQWTNLKEKKDTKGYPHETPLELKFYIWNRSNSAAPYASFSSASSLSFLSVTCEVDGLFLEGLLWMSMKARVSWPIANIIKLQILHTTQIVGQTTFVFPQLPNKKPSKEPTKPQ